MNIQATNNDVFNNISNYYNKIKEVENESKANTSWSKTITNWVLFQPSHKQICLEKIQGLKYRIKKDLGKLDAASVDKLIKTLGDDFVRYTYDERLPFINFMRGAIEGEGRSAFHGRITKLAAAFHRPLDLDPELKNLLPQEEQNIILKSALDEPTFSCHKIAADLRKLLGSGNEIKVGGFGQAKRKDAIDAAITSLKKGKPCIISMRNAASDDGHSFSLVLKPDGRVDTIEGWAAEYDPNRFVPDVTTGKKNNISVEDAISALRKINESPCKPENDAIRTEGYKTLSQAYPISQFFHLMSKKRIAEVNGIPKEAAGVRGVNYGKYTNVVISQNGSKFYGNDERGNRVEIIFPRSDKVERVDNEIEIVVNIIDLKNVREIEESLQASYQDQKRILDGMKDVFDS